MDPSGLPSHFTDVPEMLIASDGVDPELFGAGWFVESVVSTCLIVLVIRTRRPFWQSRPGRALLLATLAVAAAAVALAFAGLGTLTGFRAVPAGFLALLAGIGVVYVAAAEGAKRWFYRRIAP